MPTAFKNSLLALPREIREDVDSLIEKQYSGKALLRHLKERYQNVAIIPSLPTILKYVRYYNSQKHNIQQQIVEEKILYNLEDGITEVNNVFLQVSSGKDPNFDKIKLLEGLAGKCVHRIHKLEDLIKDKQKPDPAVEQAIVRYVSVVKDIMQSVNTLSSTHREDEKIMIQLIRTEARGILDAVRSIIIEICPDKYDIFKEKLRSKLQERGGYALQRDAKTEKNASDGEEKQLSETNIPQEIDTSRVVDAEIPQNNASDNATNAVIIISTPELGAENSGKIEIEGQFSTSEVLTIPTNQPELDKNDENEKEHTI